MFRAACRRWREPGIPWSGRHPKPTSSNKAWIWLDEWNVERDASISKGKQLRRSLTFQRVDPEVAQYAEKQAQYFKDQEK